MSEMTSYYSEQDVYFKSVGIQPNTKRWKTKDGRILKFKDMDTSYIQNCLNMCVRHNQKEWALCIVDVLLNRLKDSKPQDLVYEAENQELIKLGYTIGTQFKEIKDTDKIPKIYEVTRIVCGMVLLFPLKKNGKPSKFGSRSIMLHNNSRNYYQIIKR